MKIWQSIDNEHSILGIKQINPQKYKVLKLDVASIKSFLNKTLEFTAATKSANTVLELPMPDGNQVFDNQQLIILTFTNNLELKFAN